MFGGYGYNKEYPVEMLMRDAKFFKSMKEHHKFKRMIVGEMLLGTIIFTLLMVFIVAKPFEDLYGSFFWESRMKPSEVKKGIVVARFYEIITSKISFRSKSLLIRRVSKLKILLKLKFQEALKLPLQHTIIN